ncbi:hypothetical protein [Schlesneria paludicola]|uniref:hypothetical protein n=1 Tax=Schlesneria paludicola TaxID=360056 RepID=UPI00029AC128|nr:hypothetical protein [Schlesneria paludicola]
MLSRGLSPTDFGVDLDRSQFIDLIAEDFEKQFVGLCMIEELLLHPDQAKHFCDRIRRKHHCPKVPDDFILRSLMQRKRGIW